MKSELRKLLKEKYKNHKYIRFADGKGWNVDIYNRKTKINIKIIVSNVYYTTQDGNKDDDFYEFFIYKGNNDDLRKNKFTGREYSQPLSDYNKAINIISNILEGVDL